MPKSSAALVRRAIRYAPLAANYSPQLRTAYQIYNTGKAFAPYAKMAIKAWRSRSRKRKRTRASNKRVFRRRIGKPVGQGNAKRNANYRAEPANSRTLYSEPLLNLTRQSGTSNAINTRERNIINFRGIKICFSFMNLKTQAEKNPMFLNVAVVAYKGARDNKTSVATANFFRGSNATRGMDFGTALSAIEFRCSPINTDELTVYSHSRHTLGDVTANNRSNCMTKEFYVKLNRQVAYVDSSSNPQSTQVFLCWWCDYQDTAAGGAVVPSAGDLQLHYIQYFRETKN